MGLYMDRDHIAALVVLPHKFNFLNQISQKTNKPVEDYDYISLDPLKESVKTNENIVIGETVYKTEYIIDALNVLGQENIKLYNTKDTPVIIVNDKREAVALAPCIGADDKGDIGIPKLKNINISKVDEKKYRADRKEIIKRKKEALEEMIKRSKDEYWIRFPHNYDERPLKDKVNYLYNQLKKKPREFETEAMKLFNRQEMQGEGKDGRNLVAYEHTPPKWWTSSEGLGMDTGAQIVSYSEYNRRNSELKAAEEKKQRERQKIYSAVKRGYQTLDEREQQLKDEINAIAYSIKPGTPLADERVKKLRKREEQLGKIREQMEKIEQKHGQRYFLVQKEKN